MELVKSLKSSKVIKYAFIALIGSIALAISSKVKIPFYPVPMTMQTLVVIVIGIAFGWKLGIATISLYLFEGILGMPVFSGTPEKGVGLIYFTGPTMGYLIGFLTATLIAATVNLSDNYFKIFLKLLLSVSTIYILGILWLGILIGWDKPILEFGVYPFLLAELFKLTLIILITKKVINLRKFI